MFERVVVIGGGVAGLAATWAAAQRGAQIRFFDSGLGASCLAGGAVDDRPWEQVARSVEVLSAAPKAGPLPASVRVFAEDLGLWELPLAGEPLARLATQAGRIRVARGRDAALLDLSRLPEGARVVLPRVSRAEWNADGLARALNADAYARSRGILFEAVDAKLLKHVGEDRIAAEDLATRHEDAGRRKWLTERLTEVIDRGGPVHGLLLGPWLGTDASIASRLETDLGLCVGEAVATLGGPAGLRYEAARERLLERIDVTRERAQVAAVDSSTSEVKVRLHGGEEVVTDAVVLAIGGVAAGGIVYDPPERVAGEDMPSAGRRAFRLSLELPVELAWGERSLDTVSSIHGPTLDEVAWPVDADPSLLESIGVQCEGLRAADAVFAAGDVVADKPRTLLQAVFSGIRAGAAAAGEPGEISAS